MRTPDDGANYDTMRFYNLQNLDIGILSYIGGFLDSDGCITAQIIRRKDYVLGFQIRFYLSICLRRSPAQLYY